MSAFQLQRLGILMEPERGNPMEIEGVLNPAAVRGPDGELYLFPRLVARGNYSRIGIARVKFDDSGDPVGIERLGIALEPAADYERRSDGVGGCEDARVTFVEPLRHYLMIYTALSSRGPRIALAISEDLFHWERIGLASLTISVARVASTSITGWPTSGLAWHALTCRSFYPWEPPRTRPPLNVRHFMLKIDRDRDIFQRAV
jgi:predicted GH43/DUF377 family glycosyl hydrolase